MRGKKTLSIDIWKLPMLGSYSLQHPIEKAGSPFSFNSEDAFLRLVYLLKN